MKFTFVILHYLTTEDTVECIDSIIKNIKYDNYNIIVVDNGSYNNSGEKLKRIYESNKSIKIILNKNNLGFAKGNNLGFNYAKYELNSDFVALINNDTIINQYDFITNIIKSYNKYNFDILGPDIRSTKY